MPLAQDRSLALLASSPVRYHIIWDKKKTQLTHNGIDATYDGTDPWSRSSSLVEIIQEFQIEYPEGEDDPVEREVTEERGNEHHPGPALIRFDRTCFGHASVTT